MDEIIISEIDRHITLFLYNLNVLDTALSSDNEKPLLEPGFALNIWEGSYAGEGFYQKSSLELRIFN
eukprot:14632767-Ditylum_brightwellii.AAC.1